MSIRFKIMLSIMLAVIITLVGIIFTVSYQLNKSFVVEFGKNSEAQLSRLNSFVTNYFDNALAQARILANSEAVSEGIEFSTSFVNETQEIIPDRNAMSVEERRIVDQIQVILDAFPYYDLGMVGNTQGGFTQAPNTERTTMNPGYDPRTRPWFIETERKRSALVTEAYLSDAGNQIVCTVTAPVMNPSFAGVAGFDLAITTLTNEIGRIAIGNTGFALMLDSTNQVVSVPLNSSSRTWEENGWLGKTINDLPADAASALKELVGLKNGIKTINYGGKEYLSRITPTAHGWSLIMVQEKDEIFGHAVNVTMSILISGVVICIFLALGAWLLSRTIERPVAILAKAAQEVAEGNMKAIPQDGRLFKAEVGILHKSLLQMVNKLLELVEMANAKMRDAEDALAASRESLQQAEEAKGRAEVARKEGLRQAAKELDSVVSQFVASITELNSKSTETGEMNREQTALIYSTSSSIAEMASTVTEVAGSAGKTVKIASAAKEDTERGKNLVLNVVQSMEQIEQQTLGMRSNLEELGLQVEGIGSIIGMINDVADQTNLLALNAAIEAARAGEAGRGFAVVADEVRKLAEKTMDATKQVEQSIRGIQNGTNRNVSAVQETADFVMESMTTTKQAGEALARIETMVSTTANEIDSIAIASEQQSITTVEMNKSAEILSRLATNVAENMDTTHGIITILNNLIQQLETIMQRLHKG